MLLHRTEFDVCATALSSKTAANAALSGPEQRFLLQETAKVLAKNSTYMYAVPSLVDDKQAQRADQMCISHEDSDSERTASKFTAAWVCRHAAQHQMLSTMICWVC